MLNLICIVGEVENDIEYVETNENIKMAKALVKVRRPNKNEEGNYEFDIIPCIFCKNIEDSIFKCCKKKDYIAIRGSLLSLKDVTGKSGIYVMAEKIMFKDKETIEMPGVDERY